MRRLVLLAFAVFPAIVAADDDEARRASTELFRQAEQSYADGLYELALEQYLEAYDLYPHPGFHARIGLCHQALGDHESAVQSFEEFLLGAPDAPNRQEVEELLEHSRSMLQEELFPLASLAAPEEDDDAMEIEALDLSER